MNELKYTRSGGWGEINRTINQSIHHNSIPHSFIRGVCPFQKKMENPLLGIKYTPLGIKYVGDSLLDKKYKYCYVFENSQK